jgi:hypothetical protein
MTMFEQIRMITIVEYNFMVTRWRRLTVFNWLGEFEG